MTKTTSTQSSPSMDRGYVQPAMYSVKQVALATNLSRSTLYNYMKSGMLKFLKAGSRRLIEAAELELFIGRLRQGLGVEWV